ncbi:Macrolide export ATP-binding/permease protein MacB [subsurface metagenome]
MIIRLLKESFLFAYHAVIINKLRTFLSLLGITIGIFAIISVFTMIDWMERAVRESISSLGDNAVYVQKWPWTFSSDFEWWNILKWPVVTIEEYEEIKQKVVTAESVAFRIRTSVTVEYRNNSAENIVLNSATHDFDIVRNFDIEKGRYFSIFESNNGRSIVIIGAVLAERLFENISPVGKEITIRGRKLMIVGVFKKEGMGGIIDESLDEAVLVPINFIRNIVNIRSDYLNPEIIVKAKPNISLPQLKDDLRMILRASRKIRPQDKDNFSLNQASLLQQGFESVFAGMNIGGWIIGGFSILVGGFGIANIMFVSVKERTNIIGIQKSLGAKNNFILQEFLYESIMLSIAGGILGLFLVFCGTLIINWRMDVVITLTSGNIITGIMISSVIGIISGYAPAYSASRLDPVEAIGTTF